MNINCSLYMLNILWYNFCKLQDLHIKLDKAKIMMHITEEFINGNYNHTNGTILTLDELVLFTCSEELKNTKKYSNLYDSLCRVESKRIIMIEDIYGLSDIATSILINEKQKIKNQVIKEWEASGYGYDPNQKAKCNFCKRKNNKYFFYIKNNINDTVLTIGSTCIGKFLGVKRFDEHKSRMEQDKHQRLFIMQNAELYGYSNKAAQFFEAEKYFLSLPVLLPYNLYNGLRECILNLKNIFFSFKVDSDEFDIELSKYQQLKLQSDAFVSNNTNSPLICKRREINWIIANQKNELLEEISKNNGIYTTNSLKSIYSEEFIKENLNIITKRSKSNIIKFGESNPFAIIALFNINGYSNWVLSQIPLKSLMGTIGSNCILKNDYMYDLADILPISVIMNTQKNIITIIEYISNLLEDSDYTLLYYQPDNKIIIYRKTDKAIKLIDSYEFLKTYNKIIGQPSEKIKRNLYKIINSIKNYQWVSVEKQKKQGIYLNIHTLYEQYEHHT